LPERYAGPLPIGANHHPTVKPTALMAWLCRMVATPTATILDPFCGSGSTGRGAVIAGAKRFIGIDLDPEYIAIAQRRIDAAHTPLDRLLGEEEE
jgi:site-specific DNA-methyltransferase (adenine-specific)